MKYQKMINVFVENGSVVDHHILYYWLIAAFFFLILEIGSPGLFFFISFFFGCLVAATSTFFIESIAIQTILFFCGTSVIFLILQYYVVPRMAKNRPHEKTNVDALKGKHGLVLKSISPDHTGLIRLQGQVWAARVAHEETIFEGEKVEVIDIRGTHVVVKKV